MRTILVMIVVAMGGTAAFSQEPGGTLPTDTAIPGLMFFTLLAGLAIAIGAFAYFLRKRSNRAAAERALGGDKQR